MLIKMYLGICAALMGVIIGCTESKSETNNPPVVSNEDDINAFFKKDPLGWFRVQSDDIVDLASLCERLDRASDSMSRFLTNRFDRKTLSAIRAFSISRAEGGGVANLLTSNLNVIIGGSNIYDAKRFSDIEISEEARQILENYRSGQSAALQNRTLLEEAYPRELRKTNWPVNFPAFGRRASIPQLFDAFLARCKTNQSVTRLQNWAIETMNRGDDSPSALPIKSLPDFLLGLEPGHRPNFCIKNRDYIQVDWGGGFGHWGVLVGATNLALRSDELIYRVAVFPGFYAYRSKY